MEGYLGGRSGRGRGEGGKEGGMENGRARMKEGGENNSWDCVTGKENLGMKLRGGLRPAQGNATFHHFFESITLYNSYIERIAWDPFPPFPTHTTTNMYHVFDYQEILQSILRSKKWNFSTPYRLFSILL